MTGSSYRSYLPQLSEAESALLLMAGLPVCDGVLASAVISGALTTPLASLGFGCAVFSGAGALVAASALEGAVWQRLGRVLLVYGLVLPGVVLTPFLAPALRTLLLPGFEIFAALILLGLALQVLGVDVAPASATPTNFAAGWMWGIRAALLPQVALGVALVASVLSAMTRRDALIHTGIASMPGSGEVQGALLALAAGCALTLLDTLLAAAATRFLDSVWMRRGGAAALGCVALLLLGLPLPSQLPLLAFGLSLAVSPVRHLARRWRTKGVAA